MIRFNRFDQRAALCALLLCFSFNASADDIQDANKLFKQGQHAQALAKVDAVLSGKPKDAQARFLKALILTEQGQTDESVRLFTALSEDYPELPEPYNNLAVIYAGQGQYDKAKLALEKALRTNASYSTAHENLGDIYAKMASQAYDRALQLDRSKTSSTTKLALIRDMNVSSPKSNVSRIQIASAANPPVSAAASSPQPMAAIATATVPAVISSTPLATAAAAVPVKPVAAEASNSDDEILKAVNDWAKAWSSRNAGKYLSMYAKDFQTPNNESRKTWEQQRRERIDKPQPIVVSISNARVTRLDGERASVSFIQSYRSGSLKSITHKTLEMTKNNGSWQIQSEQTGRK